MQPTVWFRVVAAVGGGFGVTSLAVPVIAGLLVRSGLPGAEAVVAAALAGFLVYLTVLMWGLACPNVLRLVGVLVSCAGALASLGRWVL